MTNKVKFRRNRKLKSKMKEVTLEKLEAQSAPTADLQATQSAPVNLRSVVLVTIMVL